MQTENSIQRKRELKDSGFFKLDHEIFSNPKIRQLKGETFKVYLFLSSKAWRFPTSDGLLRAAVPYISKGTGVPTATVARSLQKLQQLGLIELQHRDHSRGNTWKVSRECVHTEKRSHQSDTTVESKRFDSPIKLIRQPNQFDTKERIKEENKEESTTNLKNKKEQAFMNAYPNKEDQLRAISKYSPNLPFLDPYGVIVRNLAIINWWNERVKKCSIAST